MKLYTVLRDSNTEYEPYIISINVHCYLYYECTFLHCVLSSNHEQKCVHCKENNGNGLRPKSWAAEIRSLSYTLSHCRNDIEIWWVCGKVFLLHSMQHERFTLLIYNNIKKTQLYSPHELSLKTETRHERRRSNKRYLCWFTVSIPLYAYQILFKKTWA